MDRLPEASAVRAARWALWSWITWRWVAVAGTLALAAERVAA